MITISNWTVTGFEPAMHGMRNPKNSWYKNDTVDDEVGENDLELATKLAMGGPVHAKYRRMIEVWVDISAPLYWWKEFDTYRMGVEKNSCSTMHKITHKVFEPIDFSHEHLDETSYAVLNTTIALLNTARDKYLAISEELKDKSLTVSDRDFLKEELDHQWWQMIQSLPSSYRQMRTVMLSYEALSHIYHDRRNHRMGEDHWDVVCDWIEQLPYFDEMIKPKR